MGDGDINQTLTKPQEPVYQEIQTEQQEEQQTQNIQQQAQQEQQTQHESMADKLRREEAAFWAQHAVPAGAVQTGQPPQEAGMSRKQRRKLAKQREKALKEGRRYSNFADEHTAQLKKDLGTYTTNLGTRNAVLRQVMEAHPQEPAIEPVNKRVALAYLPDYKRDKKGRPLSKRDARTALEAQKQAEDYLYGTPEAQRAVLDRIVRQMCTVSLNGEMFSPVYIRAHFAELKRLDERLMRMAQLSSLHADYFESLPDDTRELWNATRSLANVLSTWIGNTSEMSGLDTSGMGMRMQPTTEAEFAVIRQEMDQDIQAALQNREIALKAYHPAQGEA